MDKDPWVMDKDPWVMDKDPWVIDKQVLFSHFCHQQNTAVWMVITIRFIHLSYLNFMEIWRDYERCGLATKTSKILKIGIKD